jgi:membrane associated rhomboid family serine protease
LAVSEDGGPWGARRGDAGVGPAAPAHEPAIRAPWPALLVAALIVGSYALQAVSGRPDDWIEQLAFSPVQLDRGEWGGLFSSLFIHGGWMHAILNAIGALAFGAPVARYFGVRPMGALGFLVFYLLCGVVSGLGFALVHLGQGELLVGASGAVSGLMGGASRLIDRRAGGLAPFAGATVVSMAAAWIVVNGLMAVFGLKLVTGGAPIAWEAHLFGYAAGLLLIGPAGWVLGAGREG